MKEQRAASAIIVRGDGRVLIGRRSESKVESPGLWETVGGKLEPGESPEECIRREIWEELGCGVESLEFFDRYVYSFSADLEILTEVYIVRLADDPLPNPSDFSRIQWVKREDIENLDLIREIRRRLELYFTAQSSKLPDRLC